MFDTKYIVVEGPFGRENILIFPPHIIHSDVAMGYNVISAGFLTIQDGKVGCFGYSTSLNVRSRGEEDSFLASQALGLKPAE